MNKPIPVSVVIPTHNRQQLLERALRSVMSQTAQPMEVIVVDDGSCDDTRDMLRHMFPHIIYHYQHNQGVSKARNTGIAMAQAPWIALLDSDDEWRPQKLQRQHEALQSNSNCMLCHTDEIWIRRGRRVNAMHKHQKYGGFIYDKCLPLCAISPSATIIHRNVFTQVGGFDESLPACEDYDLWLRICHKYPVLFIDEPLLVKYGGHEDQLSRRYWGMDRFRIQALCKMLSEPGLSPENYRLTIAMLQEKCAIYIQGALKRGKRAEAMYYQRLVVEYCLPHMSNQGLT